MFTVGIGIEGTEREGIWAFVLALAPSLVSTNNCLHDVRGFQLFLAARETEKALPIQAQAALVQTQADREFGWAPAG